MDISQNPTIVLVDVSQLQTTDTIEKTVASSLASPPAFGRQAPQLLVPANFIVSIPQLLVPTFGTLVETGNSPIEPNSSSIIEEKKNSAETSPILISGLPEEINEIFGNSDDSHSGCKADLISMFGDSDEDIVPETQVCDSLTPRALNRAIALSGEHGGSFRAFAREQKFESVQRGSPQPFEQTLSLIPGSDYLCDLHFESRIYIPPPEHQRLFCIPVLNKVLVERDSMGRIARLLFPDGQSQSIVSDEGDPGMIYAEFLCWRWGRDIGDSTPPINSAG
jgi:hypothetical protein